MKRLIAAVILSAAIFALFSCSHFYPAAVTEKVYIPSIFISIGDNMLATDSYISATVTVSSDDPTFVSFSDREAQVRIRGNSTSAGEKKPLNIKFSVSTELFGLGKSKKWCLLANMYDKSLMRNKLALDFASSLGLAYTSASEYADVYINGEYAGNYLVCLPLDIGKDKVNIDPDMNEFLLEFEPWENYNNPIYVKTDLFGLVFGLDDTDEATDGQLSYLTAFLNEFENALINGSYDDFSKYIDVGSFVDYYIVNELFKNVDFAVSSVHFYLKGGRLYAGPVWDFDLSAGNCSVEYYQIYNNATTSMDSTEGIWCYKFWYIYLLNDPVFSTLVVDRLAEIQPMIVNLTDDNSLGTNRIDRLKTLYKKSFDKNFDRWDVSHIDSIVEWQEPFSTFDESVSFLRDWLRARNRFLCAHFCIDTGDAR